MRVFVYREKTLEEFGAVRWQVEWQELTAAARKRFAADPNYEHDHDRDEVSIYEVFQTERAAKARARKVLKECETVYGCATVTKQVVDWYVEEDRIAEWADVGEPIYFP